MCQTRDVKQMKEGRTVEIRFSRRIKLKQNNRGGTSGEGWNRRRKVQQKKESVSEEEMWSRRWNVEQKRRIECKKKSGAEYGKKRRRMRGVGR